MTVSQVFKVVGIIALLAVGALLYADLQSIHQIYRITQATIDKAESAQQRQILVAARARRDREERTHKELVAGALAVDVLATIWLASRLFRRPKHRHPLSRLCRPANSK